MGKYLKAISYSEYALKSCSEIMDSSSIEVLRFKEVMAASYYALEQHADALKMYETIHCGVGIHIKNAALKQKKNNDRNDDEKSTENKDLNDSNHSVQELQVWRGDI